MNPGFSASLIPVSTLLQFVLGGMACSFSCVLIIFQNTGSGKVDGHNTVLNKKATKILFNSTGRTTAATTLSLYNFDFYHAFFKVSISWFQTYICEKKSIGEQRWGIIQEAETNFKDRDCHICVSF